MLSAREIAKKALPLVVLLVTEDANGKPVTLGSGFQVGPEIIVTNYHVINDASRAYATFNGGSPKFEILGTVAIDEKNDLALLRLGRVIAEQDPYDAIVLSAFALPLATAPAEVGDTVYVVGNPEGLEGTFSQGIVSAVRGNDYIQITAPISHGSSGGPVLNRYGEVIGVAAGAVENGQNLNFAIPVSKLAELLKRKNAVSSGLVPSTPNTRVSKWQFVNSTEGEQYYVNIAQVSITPEHTFIAWIKNVPTDSSEGRATRQRRIDILNAVNVNRSYAFRYSMEHWEFDCGHRKMRNLSDTAYYDQKGNVLYQDDLSGIREGIRTFLMRWESVLPDSIGEEKLNFVCKR